MKAKQEHTLTDGIHRSTYFYVPCLTDGFLISEVRNLCKIGVIITCTEALKFVQCFII